MAVMYISEYIRTAKDEEGLFIQAGQEPAVAEQVVNFTVSTQSAAFSPKTKFIWVTCDAEVFLLFGVNPTATATNTGKNVQADTPMIFGVRPGDKVAAYDGIS